MLVQKQQQYFHDQKGSINEKSQRKKPAAEVNSLVGK